jgi:hypothetical protein
MTSRDKYPNLASMADGTGAYPWIRDQLREALDEIDQLHAEVADLQEVAERERSSAAMTEAAARIRGRRWP